jgi:PTH1 family peptidyl-tRNA hydrolase
MISLVAGLGNVGPEYVGTRHNLGFEVIDLICRGWGGVVRKERGSYFWTERELENRTIKFIWPTTYMNDSGVAIEQALDDFGLKTDDILVVYDDFELPLGRLRIRTKGSGGSHKGMVSIIEHLGTEDILRLRLGTGPLPAETESEAFVLSRFLENEVETKQKMLEKSAEAVLYLLRNRPEEAMSLYNQNPAPDERESGAV